MDVLLYSYYWYLDDGFFVAIQNETEIAIWVRNVEPSSRDAGDRSRFAEIWLPQAHVLLHLKQADYRIDELDLPVHSPNYRIVRGSFEKAPPGSRSDWKIIILPRDQVREAIRSERHQLHQPAPAVKKIALEAVRREMKSSKATTPHRRFSSQPAPPRTEVGCTGLSVERFSTSPATWTWSIPALLEKLPLLVRQYHLGSNIVLRLRSRPDGSNAVLSRDYASRVLFVCLARGEEITFQPETRR
ncbi:MAG: hypothetical protein QM760_01235 [Nibricoccus sp.]